MNKMLILVLHWLETESDNRDFMSSETELVLDTFLYTDIMLLSVIHCPCGMRTKDGP